MMQYQKTRQAAAGAEDESVSSASAPSSVAGGSVALASTNNSGSDPEEGSGDEEGEGDGEVNGNGKAPIPVSVIPISLGEVSSYISSTANLVAEDEVQILAEAEGRVADLRVEEGDHIKTGQILATLVRDDAEIAIKKAQLKATNASLAYDRAQKMVEQSLMSREEFDKTQMDSSIAEQELAEAEWRLEKTLIRAPFGGRVTQRDIKIGQHVRLGDALFTVSDFDPLIARIYLPERDVLDLQEGRTVRITLKADDEIRFRGRIRQISPVVDIATGTVKVTVEADSPPAIVRPGAFVTIDIVRETRAKAVLLPREAVIRELQDAYVFVANGEVAEKRTVALGLEEGGQIEAVSGVEAGEQVIVAGQGGLKNGTPIKVIPTSEASGVRVNRKDRPRRG